MPKPKQDDLSPRDLQEIDQILDGMSDPILRKEWEGKLTRRFLERQRRAAEAEAVFNAAFERAVQAGMEDPADYAQRAVQLASRERIHDLKVGAVARSFKQLPITSANAAAELTDRLSRTANPKPRRKLQDDRKYLEIVASAERRGESLASGLVAVKIKKALPNYRLPHWEKTTMPLKALALSLEMHVRGSRTINLRIGHDMSVKALSSAKGPVSFMQNQVRETLKRRFADDAPEFWFVMERDTDDLFHLHGAYEDHGHIDHKLIDAALRDAGRWGDDRFSGRAQVSKVVEHPAWWAWYSVKSLNLTADMTDRRLIASTGSIKDAARGSWEAIRARFPRG